MSKLGTGILYKTFALGLLIILNGCGGSGGNDDPVTPNPPEMEVTDQGGDVIGDDPITPEPPETDVIDQGGDVAGDDSVTPDPPEMAPETPETPETEVVNQGGDDADDGPGEIQDGIQSVVLGETITASVADNAETVYRVPAGSEIIMNSTSGDADLFLITDPVFSDDALVCSDSSFYIEHNCSADVDGDLYALVFGREDSTYTLTATNDCSVGSINDWVYRRMQDYYLYYNLLPNVNPADFENTSDLVRALRFTELDPFSNVQNAAAQAEFQNSGRAFGYSFRWRFDSDGNARVARVYEESVFGQAGIKRGDIIVSLNGVLWTDLNSERFDEFVGDRDNPLTATWGIIPAATGVFENVSLTTGEFTANTVIHTDTLTSDTFDGRVGYLVFDSFINTSEEELDAAIGALRDNGVTELVLDLRYNPGGLIRIANRLASQIAGPAIEGSLMTRYEFNDKYPQAGFNLEAFNATPSLGLTRVVVLTTGATASSSELVINSLRPYMEVITMGTGTEGKPFISRNRDFCGVSLNAMEADGVNAVGNSVVGGIPADCFAEDDVTRDFGFASGSAEGMLSSALDYYQNGTCNVDSVFTKSANTVGPVVGNGATIPGAILER